MLEWTNLRDPIVALEHLSNQALSEQLCSHVYLEMGYLSDDEPRASVFCGTDPGFVFDLASITKAVVTTPLILKEIYRTGKPLEKVTIGDLFSPFALRGIEAAAPLRVGDVLRHEAGLPSWRNFYVETDGKKAPDFLMRLQRCLNVKVDKPTNLYSDTGFILLGILLERHWGMPLWRQFVELLKNEYEDVSCLGEMGPSLLFKPEICISTGTCPLRLRVLRGEVHDENAWAMGGFAGHAGLFSSGRALGKLLRTMWISRFGNRIISDNFRYAQSFPQSDSALGWRTARDPVSQTFGKGNSIGHLGFTGTAFWIDPLRACYVIILTNRVFMDRTRNLADIKSFRQRVLEVCEGFFESDSSKK